MGKGQAYAAKRYSGNVHAGTLQSANHPDDYFDLVSLIDTLYYIDDPVAELQEIFCILCPTGWLAIEIAGQSYMLWRNYGLVSRLLDKRWSRASTDSSYIFWFNPVGLSRLLGRCGLKPKAWYVIPSPKHSMKFVNVASYMHLL